MVVDVWQMFHPVVICRKWSDKCGETEHEDNRLLSRTA